MGVAFADGEGAVLRVTRTQVTVGEYPGRHQERAAIRGRPRHTDVRSGRVALMLAFPFVDHV